MIDLMNTFHHKVIHIPINCDAMQHSKTMRVGITIRKCLNAKLSNFHQYIQRKKNSKFHQYIQIKFTYLKHQITH